MTKPVAVPLLDLKAQYAALRDEIRPAVDRVLESQQCINGPEVVQLEKEVARYCHTKHCVGVSSGTDAILLSLMALDVGTGDEVVTTPYTFFATAGCIARVGAKPVFVDIDPVTFNVDPDRIEAAITPRTKAIMPVHLFGQSADMDPILDVARRHNLPVIEDAAQAIGSEYQGKRAGSMGTVGCFSFFPSKNLGAVGDAGAVTTNDDALARRLVKLRGHGAEVKYYHDEVGGNFRLDTIHAAVLSVKLRYLDQWTAARQANAAFYTKAIEADPVLQSVITPPPVVGSRHIFNQYVIRTRDRDGLKDFLKVRQVGTEVYYPVPMHLQKCFADLGYHKGDFPHSEDAAQTTLALPIYPELSAAQKGHVVDALAAFAAEKTARRAAAG
ncbi:MAG TPA: DegT/DnrJ/EryC1/StrS family aminotransferase [Gemmataceae bacterium]|nr:DegT/DnrJ/EryC1/StrS family aminotransferase [Gemmataceae bacterium]